MKTQRLLAVMTLPTLLSAAVPLVAHAGTTTEQILQTGSTGADVVTLQNDLNALGFTVGQADGDYGPVTASEVKAFQTNHHITADGQVGPQTWSVINTAMAAFVSEPITLSANSRLVTNLEAKKIYNNSTLITSPDGFTYNSTTYMPIWYVMNALDQMGFQHTWSNNVWNIIVPADSGIKVDYSKIQYGKGSTSIAINGTVVARVDAAIHVDPASGQMTTFMPVWYVMNALGRLGIQSDWQGTTWTMKPATTSTGGSTGSSTGGSTGGSTGSSTGGSTGTSTGGSTGSSTGSGSYTSVDLRFPAPADVNAQTINQYLLANQSPMNGLGASFMAAQSTYGVDANYLVSHAILESAWGQSQIALAKNNLFGYGAYDSNPGDDAGMFPSDDYAIRFQAWEVRTNYLTPGATEYVSPTLTGMNVNYATDKQWASSIGGLMGQFSSSVGSSVSDYTQYSSSQSAPQPQSTVEPVFYLNGAKATTKDSPYYTGVPYFSDMGTGMDNMFFGPLSVGSSGQPVAEVQQFLNQQIGAGLTVDGQFGPATQTAVKKFESQVMKMATPDGVWSYSMWTQYIEPSSSQPTIPAGTNVTVTQIKQGMAGGLVMPWYYVQGYGWVDSQYVSFNNVYRVQVTNPAGTSTSVPVYSASNRSQQVATLHNGDFVVANSASATGGYYTVQVAAETASSGVAAGTPISGVISANGSVTLVAQH
ncbi:peptidoglycan-binding protein [Alicyclobacillus fastidiosus]|uniref:Peptidoglycan-binding protein n=1 Tax=Alicyclobacillus fastidiosus TaxID=392011 RepID=A0ABV5AF85_9BACL|nr:peptidoglycan-binding protein [Alicyclobacillus fastidiosus]WEH09451.1 peptidoglycan-binding protein [Alicyclobacillus fastidiosus]